MYFLSPAEISVMLASIVCAVVCGALVVVCGSCCDCDCGAGPGCSPVAKSNASGVRNSETDIVTMLRVIMRVNILMPTVALGNLLRCLGYLEAKLFVLESRQQAASTRTLRD